MRAPFLLAALLAISVSGSAQTRIRATGLPDHPLSVSFASGSQLRVHLRSGDFQIVGRDVEKITVHVQGKNADKAADMQALLEQPTEKSPADLTISGGPRNEFQVIIEVPRNTNLLVRMPAGNLEIGGVTGDKDASLEAGNLVISVGNAADYSRVDASVTSGGLEASPFGESHGGLFRSVRKDGNGKYRLRAHVGAGDLNLR